MNFQKLVWKSRNGFRRDFESLMEILEVLESGSYLIILENLKYLKFL